MKYPQEVILEYITKYITENYSISPDNKWININSVFTSDSKHRMGFNIDNNYVHDFKLGMSWDLEKFVAQHQNISQILAKEILMKSLINYVKTGKKLNLFKKEKVIKAINLKNLNIYPKIKEFNSESLNKEIGRNCLKFLKSRYLTLKHIKKFKIGYSDDISCYKCNGYGRINNINEDISKLELDCDICNKSGKNPYYGWIIIPSYENENLVFFQGRNPNKNSKFRYMNPKNISKSQVVMFYDELKQDDRIFILEGSIDAMTLLNYSACSILGNRISNPQVEKILRKNPSKIIFVPDYDETQEKRMIINSAINKNIQNFKNYNPKIEIAIYKWYKKYKGYKDINQFNHKIIEEDLIEDCDFKNLVKEKLNGGWL